MENKPFWCCSQEEQSKQTLRILDLTVQADLFVPPCKKLGGGGGAGSCNLTVQADLYIPPPPLRKLCVCGGVSCNLTVQTDLFIPPCKKIWGGGGGGGGVLQSDSAGRPIYPPPPPPP